MPMPQNKAEAATIASLTAALLVTMIMSSASGLYLHQRCCLWWWGGSKIYEHQASHNCKFDSSDSSFGHHDPTMIIGPLAFTYTSIVTLMLRLCQPVFILPIFKVGEDFGKLSTRSGGETTGIHLANIQSGGGLWQVEYQIRRWDNWYSIWWSLKFGGDLIH